MKTNTPNPLVPQGTFADPKAKSNLRMTVFLIIAGHLVLISGLLMAGCKKTAEPTADPLITSTFDSNNLPPLNTSLPDVAPSNPVPPQPANPPPTPAMVVPDRPPGVLPPPTEGEREHTIIAGDKFYTLAKKYNVTIKAIEAANPGVDSRRLKIGDKIKIPATTISPAAHTPALTDGGEKLHVVKSGDRLISIAKAEGTTVKAIKAANNLRTDRITVGQKLKIPAKTAAAPVAAAIESVPSVTPISTTAPAPMTPANP